MKIGMVRLFAAFVLSLATVSGAAAQVFTPTYTSPRLVNEIGIYVADGPGNLALEGIWRAGPAGLRVGFVDRRDGLLTIGGELRNQIPIQDAPLGLAFVAAGQALVGDGNAFGLQAGLSAGYTFMGQGMAITPYIHPALALVNDFGGEDRFEVNALADVGADIEFWNNILVRIGVNLGSVGSNWGVGLGWRR